MTFQLLDAKFLRCACINALAADHEDSSATTRNAEWGARTTHARDSTYTPEGCMAWQRARRVAHLAGSGFSTATARRRLVRRLPTCTPSARGEGVVTKARDVRRHNPDCSLWRARAAYPRLASSLAKAVVCPIQVCFYTSLFHHGSAVTFSPTARRALENARTPATAVVQKPA